MSRRTKIIIAVVIVLLLLLIALAVWLWLARPQGAQVPLQGDPVGTGSQDRPSLPSGGDSGRTSTATVPGAQPTPITPVAPAEPDDASELRRLASAFAERFGSFSTQADFENILDLKAFMTTSMQAWADGYVEDAREDQDADAAYAGTTTRALSAQIESLDEDAGTATVLVRTQRRASQGTTLAAEVYYQDIRFTFRKVSGTWKADSANWLPRE